MTMSGQKLSTLKPVVLANDDYDRSEETYEKEIYSADNFCDGEETPVKEIFTPASAFDCGQRYTSMQNIIISPRNCVNVTQDNVLDLFDEISRSDDVESHRQQYSALVQLYRDLPKDMFLSRILSDYNADEKQLYELRSNLFAELKSIEKCPFAPGTELKRRKNTIRGEGVHVKLCGDIYILTSVFDGAPFDDLKDLISISKYSSQNENDQSVLIDANTPLVGKNLPQNSDFDLYCYCSGRCNRLKAGQ